MRLEPLIAKQYMMKGCEKVETKSTRRHMARQEHTGICHICGEYKKLTYEHIPPEAAFNSQRRKMSTVKELMENKKDNRAPWDIEGLKYKQFQQGTGFFTLCGECNSFTGAKYGVTYSDFIKAIGAEILKIPKEKRKQGLSFHVEQINLLAFFKQVISMFCSLNTEQFGISFKDFLLNESSTNFDTSIYKVCMYLHAGHVDRLVPFQTQLNIKTGNMEFCSEISTFPVGFIFYDISHNRTTSFCGSDITSFSQCDYSSLYNLDIQIPFLECNTPFGLDFRTF